MRIQNSQMRRLCLALCAVFYAHAASADQIGPSPARASGEQNVSNAGNLSAAPTPMQGNSKGSETSVDPSTGKDLSQIRDPNEPDFNNENAAIDEPSSTEKFLDTVHAYLIDMITQWEHGPDETVPQFMASEREINEALRKVLNRPAIRKSNH